MIHARVQEFCSILLEHTPEPRKEALWADWVCSKLLHPVMIAVGGSIDILSSLHKKQVFLSGVSFSLGGRRVFPSEPISLGFR